MSSSNSSRVAIEPPLEPNRVDLGDPVQQLPDRDQLLHPRLPALGVTLDEPAIGGQLQCGREQLARDRVGTVDPPLEQQLATMRKALVLEALGVGERLCAPRCKPAGDDELRVDERAQDTVGQEYRRACD